MSLMGVVEEDFVVFKVTGTEENELTGRRIVLFSSKQCLLSEMFFSL